MVARSSGSRSGSSGGYDSRLPQQTEPEEDFEIISSVVAETTGTVEAANRWYRLSASITRLAHIRRIWSLLGTHLKFVKSRGSSSGPKGMTEMSTELEQELVKLRRRTENRSSRSS